MTDKQQNMMLDWMRKIHQLEYAHRYESLHYSKLERIVGISAFVLTTLVAFSYRFPSVEPDIFDSLPFFLKHNFFVPIGSAIAAILTGILTFLKPSERSETHKKTGSNYEKLRHRIELIITSSELHEKEFTKKMASIKEDWDDLDAINVSNRHFIQGKNKVNSFKKYPKELSFLDDVRA